MKILRFVLPIAVMLMTAHVPQSSAAGNSSAARLVHPNPFTAGCTFTLSMPVEGRVRIIVYDMLGRQVCDVTAQNQQWDYKAGQHQVAWNGEDETGNAVTAGTYICVLWSSQGEVINSVKVVKAGGHAIN